MNIIDNFEKIRPLLKFEPYEDGSDNFYYVEILMRKKEHENLKHSTKIKTFQFITERKYDEYRSIIIRLCNKLQARAYIRLNRRSHFSTGMYMYELLGKYSQNKQFDAFRSVYSKACGKKYINDKMWIVDIDVKDEMVVNYIINKIEYVQNTFEHSEDYNVITTLPTLNGNHIITNPFRIDKFDSRVTKETREEIGLDVHTNNPTILYANGN